MKGGGDTADLKPLGYRTIAAVLVEIGLIHEKAKLIREVDEFIVTATVRRSIPHPLTVLNGMKEIRNGFSAHRVTNPFLPAVPRRSLQQ